MKFILNNETKKTSHGFYLLNSGGLFDRFNDNPVMLDNHNLDALIGRWLNLKIEGSHLVAEPDFDEGTSMGAERKGQVERGYLKGASVGIIILKAEWRMSVATGEEELYVTQWELFEASTTPVPSNAGALHLKIYSNDQTPIADKDIKLHIEQIVQLSAKSKSLSPTQNTKQMEKTTLTAEAYVALGITAGSDTTAVSAAIVTLSHANASQAQEIEAFKLAAKETLTKNANDMVSLAIAQGKITADRKETFVQLAISNYDLAKSTIEALPKKISLSAQVEAIRNDSDIPVERKGWTHLKWLKEDPAGLARIQAEDPESFEAIKKVR